MARTFTIDRGGGFGLDAACDALRGGGVVVFPTETFYGIAVMPRDAGAVARLVHLKSRLPHKPIPLVAHSAAACAAAADVPPVFAPLCAAFWPGPLTLVLEPCDPEVWPSAILGEHRTLGIRVSSHPVARALALACGGLVTSTSANFASEAPVARVAALDPALVDLVDVVLDGGTLTGGLASTVLSATADGGVRILRQGAVSKEQIDRLVRP